MKNLHKIYSDEDSEVFIFSVEQNISMLKQDIIPKDQLAKILKYKQDIDKSKRLLSRTFLFEYSQKNYNLNNFTFEYTKNQRPKFKYSDIDFSISYSKDIIAIAISKKYTVGIDIEFVEPLIVTEKTAFEFMNDNELVTFMQINEKEKHRYFYDIWTSKESFLKAKGDGLYINPKDVENELGKSFYFQEYIINLTMI